MLKTSNIPKDMVMKNKEALVHCLSYMDKQNKPVPLPKKEDFITEMRKGIPFVIHSFPASFLKEQDPLKVYKNINQRLGEGASALVYKGTDVTTGEGIALKVASASDLKNLRNELALHRMCHHENIVSLKDCYLWNEKIWVRLRALFDA